MLTKRDESFGLCGGYFHDFGGFEDLGRKEIPRRFIKVINREK